MYLKVRAGDTSCELPEEGLHDLGELTRVNNVQYLFHLPKKHHLFRTVGLWPKLKQTQHHLYKYKGGKSERIEKKIERIKKKKKPEGEKAHHNMNQHVH